MYIISEKDSRKVRCQIRPIVREQIPKKKDGWSFNWIKANREHPGTIYALSERRTRKVHGVIQLIEDEGMLIMQLLELAPFNIGSKRMYRNVAGCLIAYGCRESMKLTSAYKGYLTFVSKSELVELYKMKYGATQTIGNRMYIDPQCGAKLIETYIKK